MKKRLIFLAMMITLGMSLLCITASAETYSGSCGADDDNLIWELDEDGTLTIFGTGTMVDYASGAAPWYSYCDEIKNVVIEDGVVNIGSGTFYSCSNLMTVTIPNSVIRIGQEYPFGSCDKLTDIYYMGSHGQWFQKFISDGVSPSRVERHYMLMAHTSNGDQTHTAVLTCTICGEIWGTAAEAVCEDKNEDGACDFCECADIVNLGTCGANGNNLNWTLDENGVLTISGTGAMRNYIWDDSWCRAPWSLSGTRKIETVVIEEGVTTVGNEAFYWDHPSSVIFPDTLEQIGGGAFYDCDMTSMVIPNSVTKIGSQAFHISAELTSVVIGSGVTSVDDGAFFGCSSLAEVFYLGTQAQWDALSVGTYNTALIDAQRHYMPPTYTNNGDETHTFTLICTDCGKMLREPVASDCVDKDQDGACDFCEPDITAFGTCGADGDNLVWTLDENGVFTVSGIGAMADYDNKNRAPWDAYRGEIGYIRMADTVTTVGDFAFQNCGNLKDVQIGGSVTSLGAYSFAWSFASPLITLEIPDSVTTIGEGSFEDGSFFDKVVIGNGVTEIGDRAFYWHYGLTTVEMGVSVVSIGDYAFDDTDISSIQLPEGLQRIGKGAFNNCKLTTLHIPKTVTYFGGGEISYYDSHSFMEYTVDEESTTYAAEDGVLFTKDMKTLVSYPCGKTKETYNIPDTVTTIHAKAFAGCSNLISVTIPDGTTNIGDHAFFWCGGLISLTLPDSVTTIDDYAFQSCSGLTSIVIPDGVTTIGNGVFQGCGKLTSVDIPDSTVTLGRSAFSSCGSLTSVMLGSGVMDVGASAFFQCNNLKVINVADANEAYRDIEGVLFTEDGKTLHTYPAGYEQTQYQVPDGVTAIGDYAFYACGKLTDVSFPDSVTNIGKNAFSRCNSLISVCISEGMTSIGESAFYCCDSLTCVIIPSSMTSVADRAFDYCKKLTDVYYLGTQVKWNEISIGTANTPLTGAQWHYMQKNYEYKENRMHQVSLVCSDCGEVLSNVATEDCDYENGNCILCGTQKQVVKFSILGSNMTLGNELELNILVKKSSIPDEDVTVTLTHHAETGDKAYTFLQEEWVAQGTYYKYSVCIAASQMTDQISIEVVDSDGAVWNNPYSTSAQDYVERNIYQFGEVVQTLLVDMLNYGSAAQVQFGYKVDDPANSVLDEDLQAMATPAVDCTDIRVHEGNYVGSSLSLEDRILLNFMFNKVSDTERAKMSAKIEFTNVLGQRITADAKVNSFRGLYAMVKVDQIVLADATQPVTVTVYNADGTVYGSATDSVESYIARQNIDGSNALYTNIMKFAASALAYKQ